MTLRERKKEETRMQIIQAAASMFLTSDYSNTSIDAIASSIGASKGVIFYHFSSKKELAIEVLKWFNSNIITKLFEKKVDDNPRNYLDNYVRRSLNIAKEYPGLPHFLFQLLSSDIKSTTTIDSLVSTFNNQYQSVVGTFIEMGVTNPQQKSLLFLALLDGLASYLSLLYQTPQRSFNIEDDTQMRNEILELFTKGA